MKNKETSFEKITIGLEIAPGLTVIGGPYFEIRKASSGKQYKYKFYDLQCFCGTVKRTRDSHIKSGLLTSCGCKRGGRQEDGEAARSLAVFNFRKTLKLRGFTTTLTDKEIIQQKSLPCTFCAEPHSCTFGVNKNTGYFRCNTLDRYDNNQTSYEVGNIITTCRACNSGHRVMTVPEYLSYCYNVFEVNQKYQKGSRFERIHTRLLAGDIHTACNRQQITLPPLGAIIASNQVTEQKAKHFNSSTMSSERRKKE